MADEREENEEINVIDNRGISDSSESDSSNEEISNGPGLQLVGGGPDDADAEMLTSAEAGVEGAMDEEAEMTPEQQEELRIAMEEEQFTAIEADIQRPLTDEEKDQVRQQMAAQAQAQINLEVAPMLLEMMVRLPNYAAVHLGLTANPYTQLIARNDENARMSIEAFGSLYDTVKQQLDNNSRREFERVLNDLRVNYTRITGAPIGPAAGGPSIITGPRIIR